MITLTRFTMNWMVRGLLVLVGLTGSAASSLHCQDSTKVSASLLRVLAEVADEHRTGRPIFLVADYQYPHKVIGQLSTRREAERMRADSGSTFGVFGPYTTPADAAPDSAGVVMAVRIMRETPGGRRETFRVDSRVDALFLTRSAIDKFLIPYYARIYGPEYAQSLRDQLGPRSLPHCHIRSNVCIPKPDGSVEIISVMGSMEPHPR